MHHFCRLEAGSRVARGLSADILRRVAYEVFSIRVPEWQPRG